jgi:hypothetical protein
VGAGTVRGAANSATAQEQVSAWRAEHPGQSLRNVYFIGHGNVEYAWRVAVASDNRTFLPASDAHWQAPVRGTTAVDIHTPHYRFIEELVPV